MPVVDVLTALGIAFDPENVFGKLGAYDDLPSSLAAAPPLVDVRLLPITFSPNPLDAASSALASAGPGHALFSFAILGRVYVVTTPEKLFEFVSLQTEAPLLEYHEHYAILERPFHFFLDLDSKDEALLRLSHAEIVDELEHVADLLAPIAEIPREALQFAAFRTSYPDKFSVHAVFKGFSVDSPLTARFLSNALHEVWTGVYANISRAHDVCYRNRGSLRAPFAAKTRSALCRKLPLRQESFFDGLLAASPEEKLVARRTLETPEREIRRSDSPLRIRIGFLLEEVFRILSISLNRLDVIDVKLEFPASLFTPKILPSRAFVQMRIGVVCPIAGRAHERAPLSICIGPTTPLHLNDAFVFHCLHSGCANEKRVIDPSSIGDPQLKRAVLSRMDEIQDLLFGQKLALMELAARHVPLPSGRYMQYLSRMEMRDDAGSNLARFEEPTLRHAYTSWATGMVPLGSLARSMRTPEGLPMAAGTYFEPHSLGEILRDPTLGNTWEFRSNRVNLFQVSPLMRGKADASNGDLLFSAIRSFFSPLECECLLDYLNYFFWHGRPQVALCLMGPEGCGKSFLLGLLLELFAPHVLTFTQEDHIQDDRFNSKLTETSVVFFDDCTSFRRSFLYDLITTTTSHGVRRMRQEWDAGRYHTTVFVAYNPAKSPIPLDFARQRRFLILEMLPSARPAGFWSSIRSAALEGGLLDFVQRVLQRRENFQVGEARSTPTYQKEKSQVSPLISFVGDLLAEKNFPIARGPGRPKDGDSRIHWRFVGEDVNTSFAIGKSVSTWALGIKHAYEERFETSLTDWASWANFLRTIFQPSFSTEGALLSPWLACVHRYQADFAHEVLDSIFPKV